jgi:hypothetical protein
VQIQLTITVDESQEVRASDCQSQSRNSTGIWASSDTAESEGRQMKQCWIKYITNKSPCFYHFRVQFSKLAQTAYMGPEPKVAFKLKRILRIPVLISHCKDNTENLKQIFPEEELHGCSPSSYIHVSVSGLYIPLIGLPILLQEKRWTERGNIRIDRSQTHDCGNLDWGHKISFLGIHKSKFLCSAGKNKHETLLFYEGEFCITYTYLVTNNKLCHKD